MTGSLENKMSSKHWTLNHKTFFDESFQNQNLRKMTNRMKDDLKFETWYIAQIYVLTQ